MKITKRLIFTFLLALNMLAFSPSFVNAQSSSLWEGQQGMEQLAGVYGEDLSEPKSPIVVAVRIINIIMMVLGILIVVLILFSGFQWMTAGGNEDQVAKAKKRMGNAVIGLVIVFTAWAITQFILVRVGAAVVGGDNYFDYGDYYIN